MCISTFLLFSEPLKNTVILITMIILVTLIVVAHDSIICLFNGKDQPFKYTGFIGS